MQSCPEFQYPAEPDARGDRFGIGVVEDDHRRLAAELEMHALQRVRRVARDRLARSRRRPSATRAGRRDARRAARPTGTPSPVTTLQHAGGNDLLRELHEAQQRQRRLLRRLQDLHVARGERRARASRPPSSAGSSTGRCRRRSRAARAGSSTCSRRCTRPPTCPRAARAAPAKKRRLSAENGISSRDAINGFPTFSDSSCASSSAFSSSTSASL